MKSERDKPAYDRDRARHAAEIVRRRPDAGYLRKNQRRRNHTHPTHVGTLWVDQPGEYSISAWEGRDSGGQWYLQVSLTAREDACEVAKSMAAAIREERETGQRVELNAKNRRIDDNE